MAERGLLLDYHDAGAELLGAYIRETRRAAGLTQAEVARRSGLLRANLARLETGRHLPTVATLLRIADALCARVELRLVPDPARPLTRPKRDDRALAFFRDSYIRGTSYGSAYRRTVAAALQFGWPVPSINTLKRRLREVLPEEHAEAGTLKASGARS